MKKNMKELAAELLNQIIYMPVMTCISMHNDDDDAFIYVTIKDGDYKTIYFTNDNMKEWDGKKAFLTQYVKAEESMSDELRGAAVEVLASALKTKAYTSITVYPRQTDDDGIAFLRVYTSLGEASTYEGFNEGSRLLASSVAKIKTAHKIMRKEADNGNN